MKSRTLSFAPGRAAPGMTLAKSVPDRDGNTLLASGTVLTSELLDRLIRRCVETVCVQVLDTRDEQTIAGELRAASARVDAIFRGHGSPAREALRAAILSFRLESTR
jgi:hypothetical protein